MNTIENAIVCCGQSWSGYGCQVCEQEEFDKFMHDNVEMNYSDEEEYEESI